jgi:hypothetical protein
LAEFAQKLHTGFGSLDEDAAPIEWILFPAHQIKLGETIECARDHWLRYMELSSQTAHCLRVAFPIGCQ